MDAGFILDDLSQVKYFQCHRNKDSEEFFLAVCGKRAIPKRIRHSIFAESARETHHAV
jgi:hypothetical protein